MTVKLISVTPDAEQTMAYIARVSNPSNQNNEKYSGLLKYCIKHNHWSVFEQSTMTLEIETTRAIAAQILRHRSFTYQEFSQRYADPTKDLSCETRDARLQDPKNRQNSIELSEKDRRLNEDFRMKQMSLWREAQKTYEWAISKGIAKEQARAVLPEGMTVSRLYMNGTLRSWVHYIDLRSANGTQLEHQEIAIACAFEIAQIFPMMKEL